MTREPVDYLVHEVEYVLGGEAGLYEFIWSLNSDRPQLGAEEKRLMSREALHILRTERSFRLVRRQWATPTEVELPDDYVVADSDFDDIPEDGWYVAVVAPPS